MEGNEEGKEGGQEEGRKPKKENKKYIQMSEKKEDRMLPGKMREEREGSDYQCQMLNIM